MEYHRAIKHGAHLFSIMKALRPLTEGSLESDIMGTYTELVADKFKKPGEVVITDLMQYHQQKGLP